MFANDTWKTNLTQLAIAVLPVTAAMHILKALFKTTSRIPYRDNIFSDPKGIETAQLITDNSEFLDKGILSAISPVISIIAILLSVGGLLLSFFVIRKQQHKNQASKVITVLAVLIYACIFLITLAGF